MMAAAKHRLSSPIATWSSTTRCIPKRFFRLLLTGSLLTLGLVAHVTLESRPGHCAPPVVDPFDHGRHISDPIVHGKHVSEAPGFLYPLYPFPDSPMHTPSETDAEREHQPRAPWLAAVICAAADAERRMIIRSTWMRLYKDIPFDGRFVVSNPGPQWMDTIRVENRTFGDMIVLDHLQEDDITSHTVKTLELYKWLQGHGYQYEYVSKIDSDLMLNARAFWDRYLVPRLSNESGSVTATADRTVIGELYYSSTHDLVFPHGSFYTVTWDMVELLSSLQDRFHVVAGEDLAIAVLMAKDRETATMINLSPAEKFDYDDRDARGDGTAWARERTHHRATRHALYGTDAIAVHQLKDNAHFLRVADCFDERGVKDMTPPAGRDRTPPFSLRWHDFWHKFGLTRHYKSQADRIPDGFWMVENGTWICGGIWNLGKSKTGFQEPLFGLL